MVHISKTGSENDSNIGNRESSPIFDESNIYLSNQSRKNLQVLPIFGDIIAYITQSIIKKKIKKLVFKKKMLIFSAYLPNQVPRSFYNFIMCNLF